MRRAPIYRDAGRITLTDVIFGLMCVAVALLFGFAFADRLAGYNTLQQLIGALR